MTCMHFLWKEQNKGVSDSLSITEKLSAMWMVKPLYPFFKIVHICMAYVSAYDIEGEALIVLETVSFESLELIPIFPVMYEILVKKY